MAISKEKLIQDIEGNPALSEDEKASAIEELEPKKNKKKDK